MQSVSGVTCRVLSRAEWCHMQSVSGVSCRVVSRAEWCHVQSGVTCRVVWIQVIHLFLETTQLQIKLIEPEIKSHSETNYRNDQTS